MNDHPEPAHPNPDVDIVIVGGGIAGGALATVLARAGVAVTVLERDTHHRDRNRGELMVPWGWAEVDRLDLVEILDGAAGHPNPIWDIIDPDGLSRPVPAAEVRADAPGSYSVSHPRACRALAEAAAATGADVRVGATDVTVTTDGHPTVTWFESGREHRLEPRLVVGADGRNSTVRRQFGLDLHRTERTHLISSVLVDGTRDIDDHVTVMGHDRRLHIVVPMGHEQTRLYLVTRDERYAGFDGAEALIQRSQVPAAPAPERWRGTPAGPCSTFGGEDAWVERPAAPGCVLIGDAAGYNSPIIGQGLSLAMRDVRLVAEILLGSDRWDTDAFDAYVSERNQRLARVRFVAQLWAHARLRPDPDLVAMRDNPLVLPLILGILGGFDDSDPSLFSDDTTAAFLGGSVSVGR